MSGYDQLNRMESNQWNIMRRLQRLEETSQRLEATLAKIRSYTPIEEAWIEDISKFIGKNDFEMARAILDDLRKRVGENDPEVIRASTLLSFLSGED